MKIAAIDGACYHNGKPDSYCVGSCFIISKDELFTVGPVRTLIMDEHGGTNQRGELFGLYLALGYISEHPDDWAVLTDSEYVLNAMRNEWPQNWANKGWVTSSGDPVKNKDLWMLILDALNNITCDISYFHIKGHTIPFGTVRRNNLLDEDPTGFKLLEDAYNKFEAEKDKRADALNDAQKCAEKNHYKQFDPIVLKLFVCLNIVADAFASYEVDNYKANLAADFGNLFSS